MITLDSLHLVAAERRLCQEALQRAGSIVGAAELLGLTRHAVKRRIVKHNIRWVRRPTSHDAPAMPEAAPS